MRFYGKNFKLFWILVSLSVLMIHCSASHLEGGEDIDGLNEEQFEEETDDQVNVVGSK